jgi:hypothetical protein
MAFTARRCAAATGPIGIVDDDPFVGDSLGELLDSYGLETLIYDSGASLLADARRFGLRCLLIDFHMPRLDGIEVVATLRREGSTVPCVLITGRLVLPPSSKSRSSGRGWSNWCEPPSAKVDRAETASDQNPHRHVAVPPDLAACLAYPPRQCGSAATLRGVRAR